jgi:tetratricopeptide (TPR) repeat protein
MEVSQFYSHESNKLETAICQHNIGTAKILQGRNIEAIEHLEESLKISREIQDREGEINSLIELGKAYRYLNNLDKAIELHREAILLSSDTKYEFLKNEAQEAIAWDHCNDGSGVMALKHCQKIEYDERKGKHYPLIWRVLHLKGSIYLSQENYQQAKKYLTQAIQILENIAENISDEEMREHFMDHRERKDLFTDYAKLIKNMDPSVTMQGGVT